MKKILAYKAKVGILPGALLAKGQILVETGLDGSVWNFPAGKWNPGLNWDGLDGFLAGFWPRPAPTCNSSRPVHPQLCWKQLKGSDLLFPL